jgi:hypothetical protein
MSSGGKGGEPSRSQEQSTSQSQSSGFDFNTSFVDPNQQGFLQQLRQQALGVAASQSGLGQQAQQLVNPLLATGNQALSTLASPNPALQQQVGALQNFQNVPGQVTAAQANNPALSSQFIQGSIDQLGADINRQLNRQLGGAGGVATQFAQSGTLGGGRQDVAEGLARESALREFGQGAQNLRLADAQQRQQLLSQQ